MPIYQLPITNQPNQTFNTTLAFGDRNLNLRFFLEWNLCTSTWELSMWDNSQDNQILSNIPVVVGSDIDYLEYKGYGNMKVINLSNIPKDKPDIDNLGTLYVVVWETPDE